MNEFEHCKSGGYVTKVHLSMVRESERLYCSNVSDSAEVARMLKPVFENCDREKVVLISFSASMEPIAYEVIATGGLDACIVDVRSVFKHALLANASSLILAHNHPSQNPQPSKEDDQITKRVKEAGELLGISLQDHLVWGDINHYFSYSDHNWNDIENL